MAAVGEVEENWLKCNFDTGAADTALPRSELGPDAVPTETAFRTATGEIVKGYGQGTLSGEDEHGRLKRLTGEFADVHKVLVSASAVHGKGHLTVLEQGGGYIIGENTPAGIELKEAYKKICKKHGTKEMIPLYEENGVYNFYLKRTSTSKSEAAYSSQADYVPRDDATGAQTQARRPRSISPQLGQSFAAQFSQHLRNSADPTGTLQHNQGSGRAGSGENPGESRLASSRR